MKVVLDTNILISGIHWKGQSEKIIREWFNGKFVMVSSIPIMNELTRILKEFKIPMGEAEIKKWENLIIEKAILVIPTKKINIVKEDPDDNKFLEAAIEGKAEYIVSQDKHLLKIKEYEGIKILNPYELLDVLEK